MKQRYYLLDTNILGSLAELKFSESGGTPKILKKHLDQLPENAKLFVRPITVGEVEYGLRVAPYDNPEQHKLARSLLSAFQYLDIDINVAQNHYAELRASPSSAVIRRKS